MLNYFILGFALLAGVLLALRWYTGTDPRQLAKVIKWLAFGLLVGLILFLALTGRLAWAFAAMPALLVWFERVRHILRIAKVFRRMTQGAGAATGQTSEVDTRFLHMTLDHDTGEMAGEVREGAYSGRSLDDLALDELTELLKTCWTEDHQSAQVLEAYLDRMRDGWREAAGGTGPAEDDGEGTGFEGDMSRDEALRILGLKSGATESEIKDAHRRLISGLHPDHGGSSYLAAKINQAKDLLLKA